MNQKGMLNYKKLRKKFKKFLESIDQKEVDIWLKKERQNEYSVSNHFSDENFIENVCLSYRHDFGLMTDKEKDKLIFECKEWMRAIKNNE